jgi:RHS repeat-associated protein
LTRATGFGLSTGGFSALFDNVTVATVDSFITTNGFSSSFYSNGAPGSNIHTALAGTAELQNGTGSAPIETYNSYSPQGGLYQTKQLYNSPGVTNWPTTVRYYDGHGSLIETVDPKGNRTDYAYSSNYQYAYLTSETRFVIPNNVIVVNTYGYNSTTGLRIWSQEPDGYGSNHYNTTFQYDTLDRLTRVSYPTGDYTAYSYSDTSNYADVTNENGWHTRYLYDGLGRLSTTERFLGSKSYSNETYTYNWINQVVNQTRPGGHATRHVYDAMGRLVETVQPDMNTTSITYNDLRSQVLDIDQYGIMKCQVYDRLGRLLSVVDYSDSSCNPLVLAGSTYVTNYYYDEVGNLVRTVNAVSLSTTYNYDDLNRLVSVSYPDNTVESYSYDNDGNVVQKVDRSGLPETYSYDSLNRLIRESLNGTPSVDYDYDQNGNVLDTVAWLVNLVIFYTYDARNRVTSEEYSATADSTDGFTYAGETLSMITYPDGLKVNYTYDALGRVVRAFKNGNSSNYATLSYYPTDQVKSIVYGNGLYANYTYDTPSRLSTTSLTQPGRNGGTALLSLAYSYNKTGTVSHVSGQVNTVNINEAYKYDNIQRLTNATLTNGNVQTTLSYQYDSLGNRVWQKQNGATTTYSYNTANDELKSSSSGSASTAYSYDAKGNLLTKNATAGSTSHGRYAWDGTGDLANVSSDAGVQGSYVYDPLGRLDGSTEGTTTTFYTYLGTETLYQTTGSSSTDYIFADGLRIGKVTGITVSYYHADALGSTRLVTSSSGSVVFADNYQPYGLDNGTPTGSETYKFTGKPVSQTTGLYYDYSRWYDPSIGRFISQDPFPGHLSRPQSLNPYVYVLDSPTSLTDPAGASPWYVDLLESLGPENDILNIAQHFTGVNTDQLVGSTLGPQAQEIFTGSRMLSGGAFLASGIVAGAGIIAPAIFGTSGATIVTTGISGCTIEEGACQAGADTLVKDLSDVGETQSIQLSQHALDRLPRIVSAFNLVDKNEAADLVRSVATGGALNPAESEGSVLAYEGVFPGIVRGAPEVMRPLGLRVLYNIENEVVTTAYPFRIPWWPEFW